MKPAPVLVLFAKKPVVGQVKTRLHPPLSLAQAEQIAVKLIEISMMNAANFWPGKVELSLFPDADDAHIINFANKYDIELSVQVDGDLGEKMYHAMAQKQSENQLALVMGCDVPQCHQDIFTKAYQALIDGHNVIGPTLDGGYYCIGTQTADVRMFTNVDWGTSSAYRQTINRCQDCQIEFDCLLPKLIDLDRYDDLLEIGTQCPELLIAERDGYGNG